MKFREKNRIPVLVFILKRKDSEKELVSLWRSGQIKTGVFGFRSPEDEEYVNCIGSILSSDPKKQCSIFDCRPQLSAYANKLKGKGFLSTENYIIKDLIFGNIENIHVMKSSMENLMKAKFDHSTSSFNAVKDWLKHIQGILQGVQGVSSLLLQGESICVNCSDGWDRTPQITSLTKIVLDPFYRTWKGFRTLIDFEWIGFGHKFQSRQSYGYGAKEPSPIFIQFLDCVYQLLNQNKTSFEFNSLFLRDLARAYSENRYRELLFDSVLVRDNLSRKC